MDIFYNNVLSPIIHSINSFQNRNAFCINEEYYTYAQLGQSVSKVRTAIQECNYHNNKVGLVINDDLETYAAIIVLWLEGDSYVPLHPNWPLERCLDICEQVELDLIIDSSPQSRYGGGGALLFLRQTNLNILLTALSPNKAFPMMSLPISSSLRAVPANLRV